MVDGTTSTQTLVVHNDPRVGESATVMSALRAQNKLVQLAYDSMKDSAAGNSEVALVRESVAAVASSTLPADLAQAATALDAKLATFGGNTGRGGRGGGGGGGGGRGGRNGGAPGSVTSFTTLNGQFNGIVALMQNGIDMAPPQSQIDTWESYCKDYGQTVVAWKQMEAVDLAAFNKQLAQAGKPAIVVTPTKLTAPVSCGWAPPAAAGTGRGGGDNRK
jgi:hypothetical protein